MDKRGQGLSTNAIILIVLGVFVLAIMVVGFTMGWSKIAPFLSSENVDDVVNSCEVACSTQSKFNFCSKMMILNDGENPEIEDTCVNFAKGDVPEQGDIPSKNYAIYGVKSCPSIDCTSE